MFVRITLNRLGGDIVAVGHANALRSYDFAGKPSFWITSSEGMIDSYKRGWCPAPSCLHIIPTPQSTSRHVSCPDLAQRAISHSTFAAVTNSPPTFQTRSTTE